MADEKPDQEQIVDVDELDSTQLAEEQKKLKGEEAQPDEVPEGEKPEGEKPEGKEDEDIPEEEKKLTWSDWRKRAKDNQSAYTKSQEQIKKIQSEKQELERQLKDMEFEGFEVLSTEDEAELKEDEPDAYIQYKERKKRYEGIKKEKEEMAANEVLGGMRNNAIEFFSEVMALDIKNDAIRDENVKKIVDALTDPESPQFKMAIKIDKYMADNFKPVKQHGESVLYSLDQLRSAHKLLNFDSIIKETERKTREGAVETIEKASAGGSKLDRISNVDRQGAQTKRLDQYTQEEIERMDEKQLALLMKQAKVT